MPKSDFQNHLNFSEFSVCLKILVYDNVFCCCHVSKFSNFFFQNDVHFLMARVKVRESQIKKIFFYNPLLSKNPLPQNSRSR